MPKIMPVKYLTVWEVLGGLNLAAKVRLITRNVPYLEVPYLTYLIGWYPNPLSPLRSSAIRCTRPSQQQCNPKSISQHVYSNIV